MELELAKQKRKANRSAFTRTANRLEDLIKGDSPDLDEVDIALDQLSEKYKSLRISDDDFLEFMQKKGCTQEEYEKEFNAAQEYYDKLSTLKIKSKRVKTKPLNILDSTSHTNISTVATAAKPKLPEMELIKFDGDPRNWLTFWTRFSKIHEDPTIDGRDKFHYLLQSTKPDSVPRQIVESFPGTETNYLKAVEYLKERFGQESVLIQVYIRELLRLVISDKGKMDLPSLYDKLQTQLRALDSLGLTKDKFAHFLFPLVESALPADLIKIWERQRSMSSSDKTGKSDLDLLIDFVKNEVETEFRIKIAREVLSSEKMCNKKNKVSESKYTVSTACELLNTNNNNKGNYVNDNFQKSKKLDCLFCDKFHLSESCNEAPSMSLESKRFIIKKKNACFVCLKKNHRANQCKSKHKCPLCKNRHFVILCPDLPSHKTQNSETAEKEEQNKTSTLNNYVKVSDIFLQTLIVKIKNGSKEMFIRAIIDTGSMKSYLCEDVIQNLNYKSNGEIKIKQSLFGGYETSDHVYKNYVINVNNVNEKYSCQLNVLGQKRICSEIKQIPSGSWIRELEKYNIKLSDLDKNSFVIDKEIKLLIGADMAGNILSGEIISLQSGITVIKTKLGYCVMGKFNSGVVPTKKNIASLVISSFLINNRCLSDLWNLDILGINEPSVDKTRAQLQEDTEKYFEETLVINSEGRYEVALPWVEDSSNLPENIEIAEKCALSTRKKLKNSGKFEVYSKVFENWLSLGIIEKVSNENFGKIHYLPHRPVIKESQTTSIRPVFNASSHAQGSLSLNDCLSTGPNLIEIIPSLLNRFRKNFVGVTSDIEKAFLQISIREKDRDFLRFLWFSCDNNEQIEVYRHRRVVFGITCSPYLLAATLQHHLNGITDRLSHTAEILKISFYVDNCVTSLNSEIEMKKFVLESQIIMASGHFNLRCWKSNINSAVFEENSYEGQNVPLLGLLWYTEEDTLSCKIDNSDISLESITKRTVLAVAHRVFDPIGFTAPVVLVPKIILQETWCLKLKWDDELPNDLAKSFKAWYNKLHLLSTIHVPRWFGLEAANESVSMHLFCDGSKKGYAACLFLRVENKNAVKVSLVHARSRVAPLKQITIPRLELLACSIGARLLYSVTNDLCLPGVKIYCWTDSMTVLCWIRRDQNWGTFVLNRVREIRSLTSSAEWRHVPGVLNPSDIASRGCSVEQLIAQKWWEGPNWLREKEENWPNTEVEPEEDLINSELRKTIVVSLAQNDVNLNWYYKYFSSFKKIVRMLAWMYRFFNNARKKNIEHSKDLTITEVKRGEVTLILLIQKESFMGETDNKLKKLRPIIDSHGLLRARTNVVYRDDTNDFKFPIILPADHPVTKLLIISTHLDLLHAGTSVIMSHLRERYWVLKSRKTVRNCIRKCVKCQRFKAKKCEVTPGILPNDRVRDASVFEIIGCDLAGPLYLKDGRKSYIVLFTCAVYRAVHMELVTCLTTEGFFQSLRRFIARRGRPSTIYTDNGTNFVGAEKALQSIDWELLSTKAAEKRIQWKFNPPSAPWWGGWWERLIQIVKQILRKILGRAALNYEELLTVICDCERVINSRPLTYVTEDIDDASPLTPERFLHETPQSGVPDIDNLDREKLTKRAKYLQKIRNQLRIRFRSEYLGQLRQQSIKSHKNKPLSVGEIVLLEDACKKRTYWNLARVLKLIPGRDGNVRLALIKTDTSELLRPIQRLFRLELEAEVQNSEEPDPIITSSGRLVKPRVRS